MRRLVYTAMLSCLVFAGCSGGPAPAEATAQPAEAAASSPAATTPATATDTRVPPTAVPASFTPASSSTSSVIPTSTVVPTATPTPTPTLHPLTISWLQSQSFPGSPITIEEALEPGANYYRYIASYLSDGLKIYALLTVPYGERPPSGWPVIVFNHGFIRPDQYRTTERYVAYVDGFARHGYIVFRSDYRGHGSSEGEARGAYGSPDYTVDILNAVAALKAFPDADPQRIGMWGHSMGGHITLRAMVVSEDIKAGVIWAGVVGPYPNLFVRPTQVDDGGNEVFPTPDPTRGRGRWRQALLDQFGTPEQNPEFWASLSANGYLENLNGPIQLHHGTADTSVPVAASETLFAQLEAGGHVAELFLYPGDDHNITAGFTAAMQRSIQFFDQYLK